MLSPFPPHRPPPRLLRGSRDRVRSDQHSGDPPSGQKPGQRLVPRFGILRILWGCHSGDDRFTMLSMSNQAWTWAQALSGVVPPLISPLDAEGRPDDGAMTRLLEHGLAGGVSGLFVLGGCGEGAWLTASQRGAVIRAAVRAAAGR